MEKPLTKNVLFFNKKGSQGKTTLSIMYARYVKGIYYTNDNENMTFSIFQKALEGLETVEIKENDKLQADQEKSNVFDFGGFFDPRVQNLIKYVDKVVIPISYKNTSELTLAIQKITEVEKIAEGKTIIVINNTEKQKLPKIRTTLKTVFPMIKCFEVPPSKYFDKLPDEGISVLDIQGSFWNKELKIVQKAVTSLFTSL